MKVAIIKYNAGNIRSVDFALQRLGIRAAVTADPDYIKNADKVIFPGVGEAGTTMKYLRDHKLDSLLRELTQPVLGICLGQQLMCRASEEGNTGCIGIYNETVRRFPEGKKIPHMGWNSLKERRGDLFKDMEEKPYVYFVHSYYVPLCEDTAAVCDYGISFSAAMQRENYYATQFHPEKSGDIGHYILERFLKL